MKTGLIINPLAYVSKIHGSEDLAVGGPVPGRGFSPMRISPQGQPELHAVLGECISIGLGNLNVEIDFDDAQAALLEEHGVLVPADNVPQQPLFACMLDDVKPRKKVPAELIVNPTIALHPFDLTTFRSLVTDHLSPHAARVWVNDPDTDVRWPYWLGPDDYLLMQGLRPGEKVGPEIHLTKAAQLYAARILLNGAPNGRSDRQRAIYEGAKNFARDRYTILDSIVEPTQLKALQTYFRRYVEQGFMVFGDDQVPLRFAQNDEPVARILHHGLVSIMSKLAGRPVKPTYSFIAVYTEGADLKPHTDREDCEFSFSLQLDYSPAPVNGVSPWALYLSAATDPDLIDPATDVGVHLANGSCLAYKGRELVHYRTALPKGHRSISLFLHYIPA